MIDRSYLFVPGNRPERFDKACASGAHAVVLDLEDAVSVEDKGSARTAVRQWLLAGGQAYVRVNAVETEWFVDDCDLFDQPGLKGIMLPKADSRAQIEQVEARLSKDIDLIPLIETAVGLCNTLSIAQCASVRRLAFGSVDFQVDTGIEGDDAELAFARSKLVIESRAAGIDSPIDGVTQAIRDTQAVGRDVAAGKRAGMGGKLCIHPAQVEPINRGFLPRESEIAWARQVLGVLASQSSGTASLDGKVIDKPIIDRANRILESCS